MKKVYNRTLREAVWKLQESAYEIAGETVDIYDKTDFNGNEVKLGVNWSSIGSVTPEKAIEFANNLKVIAEMAESFKYNGWQVVYTKEEADE